LVGLKINILGFSKIRFLFCDNGRCTIAERLLHGLPRSIEFSPAKNDMLNAVSVITCNCHVRLAYQPPASGISLSEQPAINHQSTVL
jgi:hypothetical protein